MRLIFVRLLIKNVIRSSQTIQSMLIIVMFIQMVMVMMMMAIVPIEIIFLKVFGLFIRATTATVITFGKQTAYEYTNDQK